MSVASLLSESPATSVGVPITDIALDQPNRRIRTRMSGGVGGGSCEATPYPDRL